MTIDLALLERQLCNADAEETVPVQAVNRYLLERVYWPLRRNAPLSYGDIDFSRFALDDLRLLASYHDKLCDTAYRLSNLTDSLAKAPPAAGKTRAFC